MIIDISEILSTTGKTQTFDIRIDMDALLSGQESYPFIRKEPLRLTVANPGNARLSLCGHLEAAVLIPCSRCLKDVATVFSADIDRVVDFAQPEEEKTLILDEIGYMEHGRLDADRLVSAEISARFPMKTLCRQDCRGLCMICGQDLNLGECGCERESPDLRMSAILDVFKNFKEV